LNAANEIAVDSFLCEKIPFTSIPRIVEAVMEKHNVLPRPGLQDVLYSDQWARREAGELVAEIVHSS
jgi:1-deoxy-D-xylulose-5-phosphate reductoisomerase